MGERAADARITSAHDVLQKPSWPGEDPAIFFIILAISSFRREPAQVVMCERAADARIKSAHDVLQKPSWPGEDPAIFLSSLQYRHSGESL